MRTVLFLATLVALALAGTVPEYHKYSYPVELTTVDDVTVQRQYQVLELLETVQQINVNAGYYNVGKAYDIKAHVNNYKKQEVVDKFFYYYEKDFLPQYNVFSIFNYNIRDQAKALYDMFFYAKDFETFYKTAAWARVHVNSEMFVYTFYVAMVNRVDTIKLVLPALYEISPEYYVNQEIISKMFYGKMRGEPFEEFPQYGITHEGNDYFYYANYSDYYTYGDEWKLAYFTEDVGMNSNYGYFHALLPFWESGDNIVGGVVKERRGEIYYHFYQQLLARYYLERLSNGMGEIPRFSWYQPFKTGYRSQMTTGFYPFAQRSDNYVMQNQYNQDALRYVRTREDMFQYYLEEGQFQSYQKKVDFYNVKSLNFVGNFWQSNPDLYEELPKRHNHHSYEQAARRILGGASYYHKNQNYDVIPTALDFYETSLRDPAFYQIYNKIVGFIIKYKQQYTKPYTQDEIHYTGVKVNNVEVSKLETFFDFHLFNASNGIFWTNNQLEHNEKQINIIQPRLNHHKFNVKISVKSEVEEQATFKVFVGPKYDSYGNEIKINDNWMNFVQLDWFTHKLTKGENVVERSSDDFFFYKEDAPTVYEIYKYLSEKKLPTNMMYKNVYMPNSIRNLQVFE
ncbi:hypothetical protein ACJJTC_005883 [Scirpophaga incertulas]